MLASLKTFDQSAFLFLNGIHSPFFDAVIFWGTNASTWLPLYGLLLYLVIRRYRWQTLWILLFVILMIIASDQFANIFKDLTARPRPSHEAGLPGIHTVNGYLGGEFGFYSSHASTTLAISLFTIILLGRPFAYFPLIMLAWAFFMSYTRIYLGVHYPGDILAGWVAGGLIGWGFGHLCGWFIRKPENINN